MSNSDQINMPFWLNISRQLHTIAQAGLTYSKDPFDQERFEAIQEICAGILAHNSNTPPEKINDLLNGEKGYATPKLGVRAAVFREGNAGIPEILLIREKVADCWTIPGGFVDLADTPAQAVAREVFEESGYRVRPTRLVAAHDRDARGHQPPRLFSLTSLFFICDLLGGEPTLSIETTAVGFFTKENLPDICQMKATRDQILLMFDYYQDEAKPVDFD